MTKSKCGSRPGVCVLILSALFLGLAGSAIAWNEPLWMRQFGTEDADFASGVATGADGNVYIGVGTTRWDGIMPLDSESWVAKVNSGGRLLWKRQVAKNSFSHQSRGVATDGTSNVYVVGVAWLAKVNPQGRLLWKRGLTAIDASGVATDRSGNVYISGSICGSGGIDCGVGVAKYNSAGRMLWTRQHGKSPDFSVGIATDRAGNVYISGSTCGFVGIDCDVWVAKYDSAGRMLWTRQLGGTAGFASASGVAADSAGNVYLTGSTDHSFGGAYLGGYRDAWLIKADVAGRVRWRRQIGTQGSDSGGGVAIDPVGGVYLTGGTDGSFAGANFGGAADAWVAKYDAAGRQMWKQQIGTANYESANGIATGATGNLYLVGNAFVTLPEHGDVWLAKFPTRRWSALTAPNDRAGEAQLFGVGEAGEPK